MRVILRPGCSTASQNDGGGLGDSDVRPNNSNNNLVTSVTGEGGGGPPLPPRENDERSHCLENNDHVHDDPARSIGDEDDHEDEIHNLQYSVAAASSSSYSPGADSNRSSSPSKSAPPNATPVSSSSSSSYSYHFAYAPIRATHITAPTSSQNNQVSSSSSSSHQQHHPRQKKSLRRPRKTNIHNTIKTKTAVHPYPQQPSSDDPTKVPTLRDDEHTLRAFTKSLATRGLELAIQEGDGNCLFRAVSLQVYGDPGSHKEVRRKCLDFMQNNRSHFSAFITGESFDDYVRRKKVDGVHGNNPEIQALSELFNRPVEVFVPGNEDSPINIFQSEYKTDDIPIRLSYHDGNHYNAVIDPLVPTAGLGLGLPGLKPGEADRSQMQEAFRRSDEAQYDDMALREAVEQSRRSLRNGNRAGGSGHDYAFEKEKVLAMSDLEATEIELERAIMASSLEVYHRNQITMVSGRTGDLVSAGGIKRRRNIGNFAPRPVKDVACSQPSQREDPLTATDHKNTSKRPATATAASLSFSRAPDSGRSRLPSCTSSSPSNPTSNDAATAVVVPSTISNLARDEYPQCVQELVVNGFEPSRVLRAYDLVGDNFDDLLALVMGQGL